MKVVGIPGVARVIITLSRIMVLVKIEYYVIMCMNIANQLLQLSNHNRKIHKNYLIVGISGIARVIITLAKTMLLMKNGYSTPIITVLYHRMIPQYDLVGGATPRSKGETTFYW